jgi:hypothetical protein
MVARKKATPGNPLGLVLFLFWFHGPRATLRALGDYLHVLADAAEPLQMLTGRQLGGMLGKILLDAELDNLSDRV